MQQRAIPPSTLRVDTSLYTREAFGVRRTIGSRFVGAGVLDGPCGFRWHFRYTAGRRGRRPLRMHCQKYSRHRTPYQVYSIDKFSPFVKFPENRLQLLAFANGVCYY